MKIHCKNGEHFVETVPILRGVFCRNQAPSHTAIVKLIAKFEQTGQVTTTNVKSASPSMQRRSSDKPGFVNAKMFTANSRL